MVRQNEFKGIEVSSFLSRVLFPNNKEYMVKLWLGMCLFLDRLFGQQARNQACGVGVAKSLCSIQARFKLKFL